MSKQGSCHESETKLLNYHYLSLVVQSQETCLNSRIHQQVVSFKLKTSHRILKLHLLFLLKMLNGDPPVVTYTFTYCGNIPAVIDNPCHSCECWVLIQPKCIVQYLWSARGTREVEWTCYIMHWELSHCCLIVWVLSSFRVY